MAAKKYLEQDSGDIKEVTATLVSTGAPDDGKLVALGAGGKLDITLLPTGVGAETKILTTSEDIDAGEFVNIFNDGGVATARLADATTSGKEVHGFVLASTLSGANATVHTAGINDQLTALALGLQFFLSTTAGQATITAPTGSGNIVQKIGQSISATEIALEHQQSILLA